MSRARDLQPADADHVEKKPYARQAPGWWKRWKWYMETAFSVEHHRRVTNLGSRIVAAQRAVPGF
jgi:hypothetical protein